MKLTYNIPENKSDITVSQYIERSMYSKECEENEIEEQDDKIVSIALNIPLEYVGHIPAEDYLLTLSNMKEIERERSVMTMRFNHKGVEFGFIPELEKITSNEFSALDMFSKDIEKNALDIINVLYRPIKEEVFYKKWYNKYNNRHNNKLEKKGYNKKNEGKYNIEPYDNTKDVSFFSDLRCDIFESACFFFINLEIALLTATKERMNQEVQRMTEVELLGKNGDGIKHMIHTLKQRVSKLMKLGSTTSIEYYID